MAVETDSTSSVASGASGGSAADYRSTAYDTDAGQATNFDSRGSRVDDFVKDVGADESYQAALADQNLLWQANKKRTYDLHQTLDTKSLIDASRYQNAENEQRLLHQAKLNALEIEMKQAEHNQRLRHADAMTVMSTGVVGEMVEAISNRVVQGVCTYMGKPA